MTDFVFFSHSPEETQQFGKHLGEELQPGDVILLTGNLGAGKTCLVQGIAHGLGIKEYAVSPTFVLAREMYGRLPLYHIDLYRLDRLEEIADLGLDDYFYGHGVSAVEWADKGLKLLPLEYLLITVTPMSRNERRLALEARGRRYETLITSLRAREEN